MHAEDDFIEYLFQIIEELSDDASDPYHYPVIRVLVSRFTNLGLVAEPQLKVVSLSSMSNSWLQPTSQTRSIPFLFL